MNGANFKPNLELYQYNMAKNTPEMDNIIKIEIQTLIQEYADDTM